MNRSEAALGLLLAASLSGCVRVYQPIQGFRPVVADPRVENFKDMRLTVNCVPGGLLSRSEAGGLCRKVGRLFENQGASVVLSDGRATEDLDETGAVTGPSELTLRLSARKIDRNTNGLSWLVCVFSFTILPGITEQTFAQDIEIRDDQGFLLLRDTVEGRLVQRFGAGTWVGNGLLDLTVRNKDERLTGDAAAMDLSSDLYGQLTQMMVNARVQREVLRQGMPQPPPESAP